MKTAHTIRRFTAALFAALLPVQSASLAATLDFERVLGAVPSEGMAISNQFAGTFGMRFTDFQNLRLPMLIQRGSPGLLFTTSIGPDMIFPSNPTDHGEFFLADPRISDDGPFGFTVRFDSPISSFSCYLLDLDGDEKVTLTAYASEALTSGLTTNTFYATNGLPFGSGLSGLAEIGTPTKQIRRVTARVMGGTGVGFDNLSSDYTPPPQAAASLGFKMTPGLTITGTVGTPYRIEYADTLDRTPTATNWHALTIIFLPTSPYRFFDTSPTNAVSRFYRAVGLQ